MGTEAAVIVEDKDFDDAFTEAALAAEKNVQAPVKEELAAGTADDTAKKTADEAVAKKVADDAAAKKAADDATVVATETPEAKAAKEAVDAATKKTADEAVAKKVADDAAAKKVADDAAAATPAETPEQKKAREDFEASIKPYEPTDEEKKALETFKKDFPESAAAVDAHLKSMDRQVNKRVYEAVQAILGHMGGRVQSVEQLAQQLAEEAHFAALYKAHSDYDEVIAKIPAWIKTQPVIVQAALEDAYKAGDTQAVLDLVKTYKDSQPKLGKTPEEIAKEQKAADEAEAKRKKAAEEAAALAPVNSKRTNATPKGTPDPNDYEGAFEEASDTLAGKK